MSASVRFRRAVLSCVPLFLAIEASPVAAQRLADAGLEASLASDEISPGVWATGMHRALLRAGVNLDRLYLFAGGHAWGQEFGRLAPGTEVIVARGVERTFMLERTSGSAGGSDSVEIAFPKFVAWDHGSSNPFDRSDSADVLLRASYGSAFGDVGLRFEAARAQRMRRSLGQIYNPEGQRARYATDREIGLDGRVRAGRVMGGDLTFQLDARVRRSLDRGGIPDRAAVADQQAGVLGFEISSIDFIGDGEDYEYDADLVEALWFDAVPFDFFQMFPGRPELETKQSYEGISENLRINPYGVRTDLPLSGMANLGAFDQIREDGERIAASGEWSSAAGTMLRLGGDWGRDRVDMLRMTLYSGRGSAQHFEPTRLGAFADVQFARDLFSGGAGMRLDRIDTDGRYPRIPGFTSFIPDSLSRDRLVLDETGVVVRYEDERIDGTARGPCNASFRTDASTTCLNNVMRADTKSGFGAHANFVARLTDRSRVRVSVEERMLGPIAPAGVDDRIPSAAWHRILFANAAADFSTGMANTSSSFGRDVDMPRERVVEAGFLYERGRAAFELEAFHRETGSGLTFRQIEYQNPVTGSYIHINSLVNRDLDPITGVALHGEWALAPGSRLAFGYTRRSIDNALSAVGPLAIPINDVASPALGPFDHPESAAFDVGAWTDTGFGPGGAGLLDAAREQLIEADLSLLNSATIGPLADAGLNASVRFASGLPYTRLINQGGGQVGPPGTGAGNIAERPNSSRTPWVSWLSVRAHKGVSFASARVRAFAELSGPIGDNQSVVFLETGRATNEEYRQVFIAQDMGDQNLDGDTAIDDFNIVAEFPGNPLNQYALLEAEDRFGDGDGIFTVQEQERAFGAFYDLFNGPQHFERSDRSLRLGLEVLL